MPNLTDSKARLYPYPIIKVHVDVVRSEHCTLKGHREQPEDQSHGMWGDACSPSSTAVLYSQS